MTTHTSTDPNAPLAQTEIPFERQRAKIAVGISTVAGMIGAAGALAVPVIGEVSDAAEPLGVDPKTWVIVSAVCLLAVIFGRMGQAIALIIKGGPPA